MSLNLLHTYLYTGPELPLVEQVGTAILVVEHTAHNIQTLLIPASRVELRPTLSSRLEVTYFLG